MATGLIPDTTQAHTHAAPGSDTQVAFNDGGTLSGDAGLTYNKTTDALSVVGITTAATLRATGNISPASGSGLELLYAAPGESYVLSYDRTASAYRPLHLDASAISAQNLAGTGARVVEANASGVLSATNGLGLVWLETQSPSAAATTSFSALFTSTYQNYLILFNLTMSAANATLNARLRVGGVDSSSALYYYSNFSMNSAAASGAQGAATATSWQIASAFGAGVTWTDLDGSLFLHSPQEAVETLANGQATARSSSPSGNGWDVHFFYNATTVYDSLTIFPSSGTITGTMRLYGMRN